jgi:hypothetical protein
MILHVNYISYELLRIVRKWPDDIEQALYLDNLRNTKKDLLIFQDAQNYLICKEIEEAIWSDIVINE